MVTCMLMRFSVSNFMSFGYSENPDGTVKTAEFHLYAGRTEQFKERVMHINGRNLLKFASLYGANAAGKTNLTRAIGFGRQIILSTIEKRDAQDKYCRSKKENRDKPTQFEYEFSVGDKCFAYGFTVNLYNKSILSEWLYELNGSKESTIFERLAEKELYYFDESIFSESENIQQFHFFMKDANRINNSLLLYELNRRKLEHQDFQVFATVFEGFQKDLIVIYPDTKIGKSYFRFESDKDKLTKILDYLDTGITDYDMHKINEEAFREYFSDASLADMFLTRQDKKDKDALKIVFDMIDSEEKGLGIGNMTSQILAVFYLNDMDHYIKEVLKIKYYVRYMDDFLLFHPDKKYLQYCLEELRKFLAKEKLTLNRKTRLYKNTNNFVFLGRKKNGRYANYRTVKRKFKKRLYDYRTGRISLKGLVSCAMCYKSLDENYMKKLREEKSQPLV